MEARAICDTGAQGCLITTELASRLNLPVLPSVSPVRGVGNVESTRARGSLFLTFSSIYSPCPRLSAPALVIDLIAGTHPEIELPKNLIPPSLRLADPSFYKPGPIDILLGADVCGTIFGSDKVELQSGGLTAFSSVFGYLILGPVPGVPAVKPGPLANVSLSQVVEKFWKIEEPPEAPNHDPRESECENIFKTTTTRDTSGKFITRLPFLSDRPVLGDSRLTAERTFFSLEKRMTRSPDFREKYIDFMREYIELNHMTPLPHDAQALSLEHYYIPHHGVFKTSGDSSKIRVVFNGSSPTTNRVSLNECLHTGPKLQNDISIILLNFRRHSVVFTTDIRMMFRMSWIHPEDRRYQLILWRESPSDPLLTYELNTNTYGLRSSPYIAIRVLHELAEQERHRFPLAADTLINDLYVDDCLSGASDLTSARELKSQLNGIMSAGGYELRKWTSNCPELLDDLPRDHLQSPHQFTDPENPQVVLVLGVQYNPVTDTFSYKSCMPPETCVTKRTVLSLIARTYDPCGWISPVVFRAKVFMQKLWLSGMKWDDSLTPDLLHEWTTFVVDLPNINRVSLPRRIFPPDCVSYSLHAFSDASLAGFATVVYLRTEDSLGNGSVHLLMSKTKVAPVRTRLTIPKLELMGAVLLTKLVSHIVLCLQKTIVLDSIHCWTDSQIALAWINSPPHTLQTFEANRVSQVVCTDLQSTFRFVPTSLNPADAASRGLSATSLVDHSLWWAPPWLCQPPNLWPVNTAPLPRELPGMRCLLAVAEPPLPDPSFLLERFSSYSKLIGVVGFILRFQHNARNPGSRRTDPSLSAFERRDALLFLIKVVQQVAFPEIIKSLRSNMPIRTAIRRLTPFLDEKCLIRVGGRLRHSDLPYDSRHPYLLPKDGPFVRLLIRHFHVENSHVGPNALQAILSREFWILSARRIIRHIIFKCMPCYRLNPKTTTPPMGDLPRDRVTKARPFDGVGIDLAGPFYTRVQAYRNRKIVKSYLCVFVCLATKAVHLEVVSDLTTDAFIAALSRFVSRRGVPSLIRCDNGRNFVGANNYLRDVYNFMFENQTTLGHEMSKRGITYMFSPPLTPHMGGIFEAAVKSAKKLLKSVIGETPLTFEELATVFTKIEAVLNSRPLCPMSYDDPSDIEILTPGHFLIGQPLNALPEYPLTDIKIPNLKRFQLIQQITQHFWKRWHTQYLSTLQSRQKWTDPCQPPTVGELVLLKDDNLHPLEWRRGRILKVHPGNDNIIRVVDVRTSTGVLTRSLSKLARLPLE